MLAYSIFERVGNLSITLFVDILLKLVVGDVAEVVVVVLLDPVDDLSADGTVGSSLDGNDADDEEKSKNFGVHGEPIRLRFSVVIEGL